MGKRPWNCTWSSGSRTTESNTHGLEWLKESTKWSGEHWSSTRMKSTSTTSAVWKRLQFTCPVPSTRPRWSEALHLSSGSLASPWPTCMAWRPRSSILDKNLLMKLELLRSSSKSACAHRWRRWKQIQMPNFAAPSTRTSRTWRTCEGHAGGGTEVLVLSCCWVRNLAESQVERASKSCGNWGPRGHQSLILWLCHGTSLIRCGERQVYGHSWRKVDFCNQKMWKRLSKIWKIWKPDRHLSSRMEFKLKLSQLWGTTWMIRKFPQDQLTDCEALQKKVNHAGKTSKFYLELCAWFCPCQSRTLQLIETELHDALNKDIQKSHAECQWHQLWNLNELTEHLRGHQVQGQDLQRGEQKELMRTLKRHPRLMLQALLMPMPLEFSENKKLLLKFQRHPVVMSCMLTC